ncbi:MAG TPA: DUF3261 domain-containing protein [Polyangia bacterium]|jgi:hypothetical protein|nr:DUF3261 domain-containing protein [Polyangia bacterium]
MARALRIGALIVVAAAASGCAHHRPPPPLTTGEPPPTAADLPLPDRIPGDLTLRQKLTAQSAKGGGSFETILQKRPDLLRVLGLTPFGTRAFLLEQRGHQVTFTSYIPRELPFPPTFMLLDIHRVFDVWLDGPPPTDGDRSGTVGAEQISERWQGGRLVQRTFNRTLARPPAAVTITYTGQISPGVAADIVVANDRYGYRLSIHSVPAGN